MRHRHTEKGNALIYVFVGVALFGALMFMFSRGASQNSAGMNTQNAKIVVSDILSYSQSVEAAVQRLVSKGCSEKEISFKNNTDTAYVNSNAPSDESCDVFSPKGGKAKYILPPASTKTTASSTGPAVEKYAYTGGLAIEKVGSAEPELIMWLMTNKETCDAINQSIGQTTQNEVFSSGTTNRFVGTFLNSSSAGIIGDEVYPEGLSKGCIYRSAFAGQYIFYSVLIAR